MENYFIINNTDGDTSVEMVDKITLLERLDEDYYGDDVCFLDHIPNEHDTNYWHDDILIIKGEIVVPEAEKVIVKHTIE